MAILSEVTTEAPASTRGNRPFGGFATQGADRPRAKLWANIGYVQEGTNRFINLPLGSPIDTMEPSNVRGQNEEWVALQTDRNEFLNDLKELGKDMAPGEERQLFNVVVRLRRVNDDLVVETPGPKRSQKERLAFFTTGTTAAAPEKAVEAPKEISRDDLKAQLEALQAALKGA